MKLDNPHLDHFPSLVAMFFDRAEKGGDDPFLWRKADRAWQPLSWREVAACTRSRVRPASMAAILSLISLSAMCAFVY